MEPIREPKREPKRESIREDNMEEHHPEEIKSQRNPYKDEDKKGKPVIKGPKAIERIKWKSE